MKKDLCRLRRDFESSVSVCGQYFKKDLCTTQLENNKWDRENKIMLMIYTGYFGFTHL